MEWRSLMLKNIRRNIRRYLGYLLSSTLAVTVFCLFAVFADNPGVQQGDMPASAREMMIVSQVIVALFAIFFIFYFHAALLRLRSKEFGLLLTLGMQPRQIGGAIFLESLFIDLLALLVGCLLGAGGSLLFLPAMSAILGLTSTLPLTIPADALIKTLIFFGVIFLLEATLTAWRISKRSPRMLILGARVQQTPPQASFIKVLIGLLCLGIAYGLALFASRMVFMTMIPITVLTVVATYLLFSQVIVMALKRLRTPARQGTGLLVVARLAYRMRDYARMLTVVTILNVVVLASMGAVFGVLQLMQVNALRLDPFAVQLASNKVQPTQLSVGLIRQELQAQHLNVSAENSANLLVGSISVPNHTLPVSVMSLTEFNRLQEMAHAAHPEFSQFAQRATPLADNEAHLYIPYPLNFGTLYAGQNAQLQIGAITLPVTLDQGDARVIDKPIGSSITMESEQMPEELVVVSDQRYTHLEIGAPANKHWNLHSFAVTNWKQSAPAIQQVRKQLPQNQQSGLLETITNYTDTEHFLSVTLFAGFFISCLFILAAGCSIYFKLFSQQEEDRHQFHALARIGMRKQESRRVLSIEFLLIFFLPIAVSIIHSGVALFELSNLLGLDYALQSIAPAFGIVCLLYIVCFAVYYVIALINYVKLVPTITT